MVFQSVTVVDSSNAGTAWSHSMAVVRFKITSFKPRNVDLAAYVTTKTKHK